eukprot:jgi/Tetstr1/430252/TSEL_020080.t1
MSHHRAGRAVVAAGEPEKRSGSSSYSVDILPPRAASPPKGEKIRPRAPSGLEVEPVPGENQGAVAEAWTRGRWLLALLVLQSTSSLVLDSYQQLLKDHLVVTLFLTMLVGAGGNAGNQSAIKVIRGLATGSIKANGASLRKVMAQQVAVGAMLGGGLAAGGWLRVYLTNGDALNASAISFSLLCIVFSSVVLGTSLPFGLAKLGVDPANAGTTIQVLMDILGVVITCVTCHFVLDQLASSL